MNTKSHNTKQVQHDKPSSFVVEPKGRVSTPAEVTMSDIAKKLRSVYTQMQMKHSPHHLTPRNLVEESFKSYLDDISRAILAEYYMRRQKEKKLFEHLEQIKTLIQNLQSEKKSLEEAAAVARPVSRSKPLDSVVQHLAHMACGENQERFSLKEAPNFSEQNNINPVSPNAINALQQGGKSSLPAEAKKPSSKEDDRFVESSITEGKCSDVQASGRCIEYDQYASSLKVDSLLKREPLGIFFFLRYPVKKLLPYFLTIAFMVTITLCFYSFFKRSSLF
ncbi:hypothetical protein MCQ_01130 [Candidatus Bartonella washoeensis Sb944nv]|uniref:Uncharacterized protein n=2 Tax=Candidatus Bartonella washoeensis TaxID=186739 RepID=J1JEL7_9HYPH|nr:hypothetical protein [Bartonella washoeensis]EJF78751.1 hypothetical protein MCQ_01130 [Bartonella washoeensis Sb944nv]EJF82907.1 hypothetical protein MCW_01561 [Bartonella washoeensis 085-0475]